jgi:hypothetical protein
MPEGVTVQFWVGLPTCSQLTKLIRGALADKIREKGSAYVTVTDFTYLFNCARISCAPQQSINKGGRERMEVYSSHFLLFFLARKIMRLKADKVSLHLNGILVDTRLSICCMPIKENIC